MNKTVASKALQTITILVTDKVYTAASGHASKFGVGLKGNTERAGEGYYPGTILQIWVWFDTAAERDAEVQGLSALYSKPHHGSRAIIERVA